jgi:hypothetical protein
MAGMNYRGPHVCPGCGERVSAFAAGCALCGAELDPKRAQKPPTIGARLRRRVGVLAATRCGRATEPR